MFTIFKQVNKIFEYFLGLSKQSISYMNDSIQALIDEFDLRDAIDEPVGGYSRGMLQKLSLIYFINDKCRSVNFLDWANF